MTNQSDLRDFFAKGLEALSCLRKSIRNYLFVLGAVAILVFLCSPDMLQRVQRHLGGTLYFFSVAGPFLAHVKLAISASLFLLAPWGITLGWRILGRIFGVEKFLFFSIASSLLFYVGAVFCYFVTLPYGIDFLLGFGSEELKPVISVGRCINFITIFIFAFALIFELPVLMVFLAQTRIFTLQGYKKNRRYAILSIAVLSAMLTPTPDVVNMALMGVPLYLLYEAGIAIVQLLRFSEN